jgi:16S rRNA U1498 N3-methylase RsmE
MPTILTGLIKKLAETGVEMIAPHRSNRTNLTQDGRPLRSYRHRWKIERLFAWLQNYHRLLTRYVYFWRISPACSISPARSSCSAIYEMGSSGSLLRSRR